MIILLHTVFYKGDKHQTIITHIEIAAQGTKKETKRNRPDETRDFQKWQKK